MSLRDKFGSYLGQRSAGGEGYLESFDEDVGTFQSFDAAAERLIVDSDSSIKRVERDGYNDYYYLFKSPLTKFRGFWGTVFLGYWPVSIMLLLFLAIAMNGGVLESGKPWAIHGWIGEHYNYMVESDEYKKPAYFVHWFGQTLYVKATVGLAGIFMTALVFWNLKLLSRYFFLARMTGGRTLYSAYAHYILLVMVAMFWLGVVIAWGMSGEWVFNGVGKLFTSWAGITNYFGWLFKQFASIPLLFVKHTENAIYAVLLPYFFLLTLGTFSWVVTWPGFLWAIVNERRGRFALVTHSAPIAEAVQCLEMAGQMNDRLRAEAEARYQHCLANQSVGGVYLGAAILPATLLAVFLLPFAIFG